MSSELFAGVINIKEMSDMNFIILAQGVVDSNDLGQMQPNSNVTADEYDKAIFNELKVRIIDSTNHFGLSPDLVFENIQPTLPHYLNYLKAMVIEVENKNLAINAIKRLINFPYDFCKISKSSESVDDDIDINKYNEFIKSQNQILIHQLMLFTTDVKQKKVLIQGIAYSRKVHHQSFWVIHQLVQTSCEKYDLFVKQYDGKTPYLLKAYFFDRGTDALKEFISKYLEHVHTSKSDQEVQKLLELALSFGRYFSHLNQTVLSKLLPAIFNKLLNDCCTKFNHLYKIQHILAYISYIEVIFPFLSFQELVSISSICTNYNRFFNFFPKFPISVFAKSPTKIRDIESMNFLSSELDDNPSVMCWKSKPGIDDPIIIKFICNPNIINNHQEFFKRYQSELIAFFNCIQKSLGHLQHFFVNELDKDWEQRDYGFLSILDFYRLYIEDGQSFDKLMSIINITAQGPFLIESIDTGDRYADCTYCSVNHYKAFLILICLTNQDAFAKLIPLAKLLDNFNYSLIKHILIYAMFKRCMFDFFDDYTNSLIEFALWINTLGSDAADIILHIHDSQLTKDIEIIKQHGPAEDGVCSETHDFILEMLNKLWSKLEQIIKYPALMQALMLIKERNALSLLFSKFNISQLATLAAEKSSQPALQGLSLLSVLVVPEMMENINIYHFHGLLVKAEVIFSEYAALQSVALQPESVPAQRQTIMINNPHAFFAPRLTMVQSSSLKLSEISTEDLEAELERRRQLSKSVTDDSDGSGYKKRKPTPN